MYKFTYSIIVLFFVFSSLKAQSPYTAKFNSASGEKRVEVYISNANLTVKGTSKSNVIVNASGMEPIPDRAKGLRPLSQLAADNTGLGLEIKESNNIITIKQTSTSELEVTLEVPKNADLFIEHSGRNKGPMKIDNIEGEMELSVKRSMLQITGAVGPIVANSTGGDIEIKFRKLSQEGPTSINTVSGFVDVTLPADSKVNLELTTLSDDIFTDFEVKMEKKEEEQKNKNRHSRNRHNRSCECKEKNITGTINGGGVEMYLKSVRDNIYLRKG